MKKFLTLLLAAVMLMTVALPMTSCSPAARLNRMDEPDHAVKRERFFKPLAQKFKRRVSICVSLKIGYAACRAPL